MRFFPFCTNGKINLAYILSFGFPILKRICWLNSFLRIIIANKNTTSKTVRLHSDVHGDNAEEDVFPNESKRARFADVALSTQPLSNRETDQSVARKESNLDSDDVEKDLSAQKTECVEPSSLQTFKQVHIIKYFHFATF